jgi:ribonuclease E
MTEPLVNGPAASSSDATAAPKGPATPPGATTPASERPGASTDRPEPRATDERRSGAPSSPGAAADDRGGDGGDADLDADGRPRRRRGSRGGRNRSRSAAGADGDNGDGDDGDVGASGRGGDREARPRPAGGPKVDADGAVVPKAVAPKRAPRPKADDAMPDELPDLPKEGKALSVDAAERALVRKPKIGDSRPAPAADAERDADDPDPDARTAKAGTRRRRGGRGRGSGNGGGGGGEPRPDGRSGAGRGRSPRSAPTPVQASMPDLPLDLDEDDLNRRRGRERKGRPVGRYLMCVSVSPKATQIAVLEGRNLIEHYVSRPADDIAQIHGNIYLGKVQNVLPGMEAAFIDIGTPKNAVLYRGDVQYDAEDIEEKGQARIEQILKPKQTILCQVTKNPIAHKGARLTQEVSLPGRFVVLIPNSTTYGISKRLADDERKRLRNILDKVRPKGHGLIVRTAADGVTAEEIERDVLALQHQWEQIEALAKKTNGPALLYREPDMAVRVIREEFNQEYRGIVIDDPKLFEEIRSYVNAISPALADRVQLYDLKVEPLSIFERHHVHEQLHRALDRKVWLPSGGSLIIEHTEALTVIDVNTGKNVGSSNLEETVYRNNLEAAEEIAKQLRLRDIGGIIVIDFIDMEIEQNRRVVIKAFRDALARDKTRTQVFDISDLGLVEMTRKRIGEGLLEGFTSPCPECEGRGLIIDHDLMA